ncbi:NUDIX domain-containing protein [Streptosporangium sandarakinum]|uniref:NUDIX domain-containing protein n=1 Tax=Streptosporangium sandarakinum TaxID=1260955 RepID=UPI003D8C9233
MPFLPGMRRKPRIRPRSWSGSAPALRCFGPKSPPRRRGIWRCMRHCWRRPSAASCSSTTSRRNRGCPAGTWTPGEDPRITVRRELAEELGIAPPFHERFGGDPFFLTITRTRGVGSHTDVTLWFVFAADRSAAIEPGPREFSQVRWFGLDDAAAWAGARLDP